MRAVTEDRVRKLCVDRGFKFVRLHIDPKMHLSHVVYRCANKTHPARVQPWGKLQSGRGCNLCGIAKRGVANRIPDSEIIQLLESRGCTFIKSHFKKATWVKYRCADKTHPEQDQPFGSLQQGRGCKLCGYARTRLALTLDIQTLKVRCAAREYTLKSVERNEGQCDVTFVCKWAKEHTQSLGQVSNESLGCGCRTHESGYEYLVRSLVEHLTGIPWPKASRRRVLRHRSKTKYVPWEIDLFNADLSVGIEVDGEHHERDTGWGEALLKKVQQRDCKKTAWCAAHRIVLIRLPHSWLALLKAAAPSEQQCMMQKVLREYGVRCLRSPGAFILKSRNLPREVAQLNRLRDHALSVNCPLVSTSWMGSQTPHDFVCGEHGAFSRSPALFCYQTGCPKCGRQKGRKARAATLIARSRDRFLALCGSDYEMQGEFRGTMRHVDCKCLRHGTWFLTKPGHCHEAGYVQGCPACTKERFRAATATRKAPARKPANDTFIEEWHARLLSQ